MLLITLAAILINMINRINNKHRQTQYQLACVTNIWPESLRNSGQMLVTHARWGNLAREWMPYAFSLTTQPYNALYFNISQLPQHDSAILYRGIYESGILLLTYFDDYYIVKTGL